MSVFGTRKKYTSVNIAKERLKALLVSDRVNCTPDSFDRISNDLYQTLTKYMDIDRQNFHVQISRKNIFITLSGEHS